MEPPANGREGKAQTRVSSAAQFPVLCEMVGLQPLMTLQGDASHVHVEASWR